MICYRKCLFTMENIRRTIFHELGSKISLTISYRAFSSQIVDPPQMDPGGWFTPKKVQEMTRRELQSWCKKLGIRANTKTLKMRADLVDFHQNILSNSDILRYPYLPFGTNNVTSYTRQDKLLLNNNWHTLTDLGQVRHFKNTPGTVDGGLLEDAVFYSDAVESHSCPVPGNPLPSVSKILRSTAPKSKLFAISHWTKRQKELLGEDVFREKMKEIKKKGLEFHHFVHRCLVDRHLNSEVPERLQGYLASTRKVFDKLGDAIASEKSVCHAYLGYQGRLDTLACYHGNPCIIEWKTSQRQKPSLADCGEYPMQMVAYAGAINGDPTNGIQIRHGLLVIAYEDGSPADVHLLDVKQCRSFWQDWLVRLHKFKHE